MLRSMVAGKDKFFSHDPALRGFHAIFRAGEVNHCPACGRSHWWVGRLSAECGFCGTALPLAETDMLGTGLMRGGRRTQQSFEDAA